MESWRPRRIRGSHCSTSFCTNTIFISSFWKCLKKLNMLLWFTISTWNHINIYNSTHCTISTRDVNKVKQWFICEHSKMLKSCFFYFLTLISACSHAFRKVWHFVKTLVHFLVKTVKNGKLWFYEELPAGTISWPGAVTSWSHVGTTARPSTGLFCRAADVKSWACGKCCWLKLLKLHIRFTLILNYIEWTERISKAVFLVICIINANVLFHFDSLSHTVGNWVMKML